MFPAQGRGGTLEQLRLIEELLDAVRSMATGCLIMSRYSLGTGPPQNGQQVSLVLRLELVGWGPAGHLGLPPGTSLAGVSLLDPAAAGAYWPRSQAVRVKGVGPAEGRVCSGCPCWWVGSWGHGAQLVGIGGDPFSWPLGQLLFGLVGFPHRTSKGCQHSSRMRCSS